MCKGLVVDWELTFVQVLAETSDYQNPSQDVENRDEVIPNPLNLLRNGGSRVASPLVPV